MALLDRKITYRTVLRVLISGFVMVLLAAVTAGYVGVRSLGSIQENAGQLLTEVRLASSLVVQIQRQLTGLSAVTYRLSEDPERINDVEVRALIDDAERAVTLLVESGQQIGDEALWQQLAAASKAFSDEARRCLNLENVEIAATLALFQHHEALIAVAAKLMDLSYGRAIEAQAQIDRQSQRLARETAYIAGGCLLLALVISVLTLRMAGNLMHRMESQASELSRISWQMLESQETTVRRFSHELHDELGQSLTAVKANLASLKSRKDIDEGRLNDSLELVDESIQNVREMSHLLHPRVLDDFGLDAALRSLVERLSERTNVAVDYESNFERRLPLDTATHLFRIAQEAFTNVMKHSKATQVQVRLWRGNNVVELSIRDNGQGFSEGGGEKGLGLVAMAARARQLGGQFTARPAPDKGTVVEVRIPVSDEIHGEEM